MYFFHYVRLAVTCTEASVVTKKGSKINYDKIEGLLLEVAWIKLVLGLEPMKVIKWYYGLGNGLDLHIYTNVIFYKQC